MTPMIIHLIFPLSQKYIDFINTVDGVDADFLEGTTASGKTTVGTGIKFMRMVSRSRKRSHIIAAKTTGIAEKNIIQQDNGILDLHKNARYYGNGDKDNKLPHIKFEGKVIYVLGYDNKDKWELVLGSQFGCVFIDEINTANIDFVREVSTRNDYLMATMNPDDPDLPVYKEFVNRSRPYKKYAADVPSEIIAELTEEPVPRWRYWFFRFQDNLSLTEEDIQKKIRSAPPGTKLHKNKIEGLRGKATGLIFPNFSRKRHVVTGAWVRKQVTIGRLKFKKFTAGLDTSYSSKSPDTILERCRKEWGFAKDVFIDCADQATITELRKYKRLHGCLYNFIDSYKKVEILDRIKLMLGWIQQDCYLVVDTCTEHLAELGKYKG